MLSRATLALYAWSPPSCLPFPFCCFPPGAAKPLLVRLLPCHSSTLRSPCLSSTHCLPYCFLTPSTASLLHTPLAVTLVHAPLAVSVVHTTLAVSHQHTTRRCTPTHTPFSSSGTCCTCACAHVHTCTCAHLLTGPPSRIRRRRRNRAMPKARPRIPPYRRHLDRQHPWLWSNWVQARGPAELLLAVLLRL